MTDLLADYFRTDVGCAEADAALLAGLARDRVPRLAGSAEDTEEDVLLRLADPRVFGAFVGGVLSEEGLSAASRSSLAEHVFDLLPLPRSEGDVILVESRAPPDLLRTALVAAEPDGLTVLHVMHLVYAVFLDRALVSGVPGPVRSRILDAVVHQAESTERVRALYACLHLAAVDEPEARRVLRRILRDRRLPESLKVALARAVGEPQVGVSALARMALDEGLLAAESADAEAPEVVANIPRFPARLQADGQQWLRRHGHDREPSGVE